MIDSGHRAWAVKKLLEAREEIPALLDGDNAPTPAYQAWVSSVKRALSTGLGPDNPFLRDFDGLTTVISAGVGQLGVRGSFRTVQAGAEPHEVLTSSRALLDDALALMGHSDSGALHLAALKEANRRARDEKGRTAPTLALDGVPPGADPVLVNVAPAAAMARVEGSAMKAPIVLVSYAWGEQDFQDWIEFDLAGRLRASGVETRLDRWEVSPGYELTEFMESALRESDFVLVVCTPTYREKANDRRGGVGYESIMMTAQAFAGVANKGRFIPVLRIGDAATAMPTWLGSRAYVDLRGTPGSDGYEAEFTRLVNALHRYAPEPPVVGPIPPRPAPRLRS